MQVTNFSKRLLAASVAATMFVATGAHAQTAASSQMGSSTEATASGTARLTAADRKAITDMAMSSMAEVEMGKLAQSKSQNAEVKAFGQKMVDDHGKALTEVQTLAQAKGVTLPTALDAKHKALAAKLEKSSGSSFDKAYARQGGVAAHKDTLAKLQKASKATKDADVKSQVDKTIPVVQEHLKHAQQLVTGKAASTGTSGTAGQTGTGQ